MCRWLQDKIAPFDCQGPALKKIYLKPKHPTVGPIYDGRTR